MKSELLSMRDAAAYCGLAYETFRQYANAGLVAAVRYPGKDGQPRRKRQFLPADLNAFIAANRGPGPGPIENEQRAEAADNVARFKRGQPSANVYEKGWHERVARK